MINDSPVESGHLTPVTKQETRIRFIDICISSSPLTPPFSPLYLRGSTGAEPTPYSKGEYVMQALPISNSLPPVTLTGSDLAMTLADSIRNRPCIFNFSEN